MEQLRPESWEVADPKVSDAAATRTSSVEHDDMHESSFELVFSASGREESPVQHVVLHADVQSSSPTGSQLVRSPFVETVVVTDVERKPKEFTLVHETQVAVLDDSGMVMVVHEDRPATHNNPNIH